MVRSPGWREAHDVPPGPIRDGAFPGGVACPRARLQGIPKRARLGWIMSPEKTTLSQVLAGVSSLPRRRFLQVVFVGLAAAPVRDALTASASAGRPSAEEEGQSLAAELRRHPPALSTAGTLRRRDPRGRWLPALPVQLEIRGDDAFWESLYRVFAPSGALFETLSISHAAGRGSQYALRRAGDADSAAGGRALEGNATAVPFAESDFWLCDLGLEFLHWPAQRIAKTEMRKGRSCRVLESLNPNPEPGVYARVLAWVDIESGGLMRAEAFGPDGRRLKEFNIGSLQKINGRFHLKSMEIRDARTDARTRLEFELEISD